MILVNILRFYISSIYWASKWRAITIGFFGLLGSAWTAVELIDYFSGDDNYIPRTFQAFIFIAATSLLISLIINYQKLTFRYKIQSKDINISLVIGDIFSQKADIVISTNTTFDTTTENRFISPASIQGQLYRYYDKIGHLDSEIENALIGIEPKEILSRTKTKRKRYPYGTIIKLNHQNFFSYWVAMADVNESGKPSSSFVILQECLERLWDYILTSGHMDRIAVPILGSGKTGINENRVKLLKEIIFSFVAFSREKKITEELVICIHPNDFFSHSIDLDYINKYLEYICEFGYESKGGEVQSHGIDI